MSTDNQNNSTLVLTDLYIFLFIYLAALFGCYCLSMPLIETYFPAHEDIALISESSQWNPKRWFLTGYSDWVVNAGSIQSHLNYEVRPLTNIYTYSLVSLLGDNYQWYLTPNILVLAMVAPLSYLAIRTLGAGTYSGLLFSGLVLLSPINITPMLSDITYFQVSFAYCLFFLIILTAARGHYLSLVLLAVTSVMTKESCILYPLIGSVVFYTYDQNKDKHTLWQLAGILVPAYGIFAITHMKLLGLSGSYVGEMAKQSDIDYRLFALPLLPIGSEAWTSLIKRAPHITYPLLFANLFLVTYLYKRLSTTDLPRKLSLSVMLVLFYLQLVVFNTESRWGFEFFCTLQACAVLFSANHRPSKGDTTQAIVFSLLVLMPYLLIGANDRIETYRNVFEHSYTTTNYRDIHRNAQNIIRAIEDANDHPIYIINNPSNLNPMKYSHKGSSVFTVNNALEENRFGAPAPDLNYAGNINGVMTITLTSKDPIPPFLEVRPESPLSYRDNFILYRATKHSDQYKLQIEINSPQSINLVFYDHFSKSYYLMPKEDEELKMVTGEILLRDSFIHADHQIENCRKVGGVILTSGANKGYIEKTEENISLPWGKIILLGDDCLVQIRAPYNNKEKLSVELVSKSMERMAYISIPIVHFLKADIFRF